MQALIGRPVRRHAIVAWHTSIVPNFSRVLASMFQKPTYSHQLQHCHSNPRIPRPRGSYHECSELVFGCKSSRGLCCACVSCFISLQAPPYTPIVAIHQLFEASGAVLSIPEAMGSNAQTGRLSLLRYTPSLFINREFLHIIASNLIPIVHRPYFYQGNRE